MSKIRVGDHYKLPLTLRQSGAIIWVEDAEGEEAAAINKKSDDWMKLHVHVLNNYDRIADENERLRRFVRTVNMITTLAYHDPTSKGNWLSLRDESAALSEGGDDGHTD